VFLGTHTPRLDDKGRLFLPAKFRDELAEGLVVTRGQERCLYVWPSAEFRSFTEPLRRAPLTDKRARDFMRMLFAGATAELADKQGRVTLPPMLRSYAGLERDCVVIGAFNRVEIWDAEAWKAYSDEQEPAFADWSEEVWPDPARSLNP
jgi:MraZ protein